MTSPNDGKRASPSEIRLISCPFHNGIRNVSMGRGPIVLANDAQLQRELADLGFTVTHADVASPDESKPEIARTLQVIRSLQAQVARSVSEGAFPLVLAGNCNSALGTTAAVQAPDLGVVWFDAHADFDDPEENVSGFFDVMGLAMLTGRGWRALRSTIPGHTPIEERNVVLAAVRDVESYQQARLTNSHLLMAPRAVDEDQFDSALRQLGQRTERVYLHIDLDALDEREGRANEYAAANGPSLSRLRDCVGETMRRFNVLAAALTAYDPAYDPDGRVRNAARQLLKDLATGLNTRQQRLSCPQ